jgi:hypothetical protein
MESMDSYIPNKPKKVGWTKKYCKLCKKLGGLHKSHNTGDCCCLNKDGTPIKKNGGTGKPNSKEKGHKGVNFVQIFNVELKKVFHKYSHKRKKCRMNESESNDDSDYSS